MAFTVTPTSGSAPYIYTAEFFAKESLFTGKYELEARPRASVGSCPAPATTGARSTGVEDSLLLIDGYSTVTSVALGSCSNTTLVIRELATGTIISQATAQISNVE